MRAVPARRPAVSSSSEAFGMSRDKLAAILADADSWEIRYSADPTCNEVDDGILECHGRSA